MLSNYPPGVTGNEDHFGPRSEYPYHMTCETSPAEIWVLPKREMDADSDLRIAGKGAIAVLKRMELVEVYQCPFEGEVDVQEWNYTITWECPLCGAEHEIDKED